MPSRFAGGAPGLPFSLQVFRLPGWPSSALRDAAQAWAGIRPPPPGERGRIRFRVWLKRTERYFPSRRLLVLYFSPQDGQLLAHFLHLMGQLGYLNGIVQADEHQE
jgi:hypothetical protein